MANDLGNDIASVLEELAEPITIYNYNDGFNKQGYMELEREIQNRNPFDSNFLVRGTFPYNTAALLGDLISLTTVSEQYILAVIMDEVFEQGIVSKEAFLYQCNVQVTVKRKGEQTRNDNYELVSNWNTIFEDEYALFTGQISDQQISDNVHSQIHSRTRQLYISSQLDVQIDDRIIIDNKNFQVQLVEIHRLPGVKICQLTDDSRE